MAENLCCAFCEELPAIARPGRGSAGRCPVCKQTLWNAPGGGTYRIDPNAPVKSHGGARWLARAGVGLAIGLCGILGIYATRQNGSRETPAVQNPPTPRKVAVAPTPAVAPERPAVQTKPALPRDAAHVKPAPAPIAPTPMLAAVKRAPVADWGVEPTVKSVTYTPVPLAAQPTMLHATPELLVEYLRRVPEADLHTDYAKKSNADLAAAAKTIVSATKDDPDRFVRDLKKNRPDLAGLPFLMGKDCTKDAKQARDLQTNSLFIRMAMTQAIRDAQDWSRKTIHKSQPEHRSTQAAIFWDEIGVRHFKGAIGNAALPAFKQILMAESPEYRVPLIKRLKDIKEDVAVKTLVDFAVFDPSPEVRQAALVALRDRPAESYRQQLLTSLRYPWAPAVQHAAEAVVVLGLNDTVPTLAAMLDEPDPTTPYVVQDGRSQKTMVRELVRVNHHRNCMLCHAPVDEAVVNDPKSSRTLRELPLGPVTSMQDTLPPSSTTIYYSTRPGITVVRADITYLRQDFSVQLNVDKRGKWPEMQRYDFFVRTREATPQDLAQLAPTLGVSDFKEAILIGLRGLTGRNNAPNSQAWSREVQAAPQPSQER